MCGGGIEAVLSANEDETPDPCLFSMPELREMRGQWRKSRRCLVLTLLVDVKPGSRLKDTSTVRSEELCARYSALGPEAAAPLLGSGLYVGLQRRQQQQQRIQQQHDHRRTASSYVKADIPYPQGTHLIRTSPRRVPLRRPTTASYSRVVCRAHHQLITHEAPELVCSTTMRGRHCSTFR